MLARGNDSHGWRKDDGMKPDKIEVDFYFMGIYQGRGTVNRKSICGAFLSGDFTGAMKRTADMVSEIDGILQTTPPTPPPPPQKRCSEGH